MMQLRWLLLGALLCAGPAYADDAEAPEAEEPTDEAGDEGEVEGDAAGDETPLAPELVQPEPEPEPEPEPAPAADPLESLSAGEIEALRALLREEDEEEDDNETSWPSSRKSTWHGPAPEPEAPRPTWSDFIGTTLTFYVGDDNLLAGTDDRSPNLGMANEYPELFFEGLNSEKQAVVSETHMVLYAGSAGYLPFVETEAAFVAEFELSRDPDDNQLIGRFKDDGSYIGLEFFFNKAKTGPSLKLTAWPYSANRFRLGYTYDLTWGGNQIWVRNQGPVPGAKLNFKSDRFYAFIGAKSLVQLRADNDEAENFWGVLAGFGPNFELGRDFKLSYDASGGYFSRGTFEQDPFRSTPLTAFGVSQRAQLTLRTKMGLSPDLKDLRNTYDNFTVSRSLVPNYEGNWGFGVGAEFTTLWQSLIDADDPSAETFDNAITGGIFAQARFLKGMRVGVDVVYRDVSFLVFNVPGLTPFLSFASETIRKPQVYGALWWDYYIAAAHLTPGVVLGVMQPASFLSGEDSNGDRRLEVIREANDYELMPTDIASAFTIISVKGSLKWHLSSILAVIGEVSYTQDYNVTRRGRGDNDRTLDDAQAQRLGLNLLIQASF